MDYKDHIARAVKYIEENLTSEIDLAACAAAAGYSKYHFLRVFREVVGLTPADYIRKRRLSEVAKRIAQDDSDEYISEIAFAYGFNSKENFTRSFKNERCVLPTEYKKVKNSLKLYDALSFNEKPFFVLPKYIELPSFSLTVYKSDEDSPPKFWNKYNAKKLSLRLSGGVVCEDYGVSFWNKDESRLDYFIGIKSENVAGEKEGTIEIKINGGVYAVFETPVSTHADFVNTIHRTWQYINDSWHPKNGYRRKHDYELETYIEESRTFSEKIYIPLEVDE
ncbi:MAG TPA: AraC family transcriptional regulator [Bacillota bacterium]|nr:AraC family transcriptional regulator [Bacillota bacterium]